MKIQFGQMLFNSSFINDASLMSRENNYNTENEKILKAIIAGGLYPNVAYRKIKMNSRGPGVAWIKTMEGRVKLFGSSVNAEVSSDISSYLVYHEKQKINNSIFLFDSTAIQPYSIVLFGDNVKTGTLGDTSFLSVGGIAQ